MKVRALCSIASVLAFSGCEEKKEVVVTETRPLTTRDATPMLDATPDQRFRDAKPSPVTAVTPEGWLAQPASQFRLLNYRFGETGMGEVWVSIASGTVLDNVNRWLRQFGAEAVDEAGLAKLPAMTLAGAPGVWVSAAGDYAGGMGAPPKPGFALAGVVAEAGGRILTVKMIGPKAEVEAAKPVLENYIRSVRLAE